VCPKIHDVIYGGSVNVTVLQKYLFSRIIFIETEAQVASERAALDVELVGEARDEERGRHPEGHGFSLQVKFTINFVTLPQCTLGSRYRVVFTIRPD